MTKDSPDTDKVLPKTDRDETDTDSPEKSFPVKLVADPIHVELRTDKVSPTVALLLIEHPDPTMIGPVTEEPPLIVEGPLTDIEDPMAN